MASDYFLKLPNIEGESQDSQHKNEIDVRSFKWGALQPGLSATGGGSGAGKVRMLDFEIVAPVSKASPGLMQACADGTHLDTVTFTVRKAGQGAQEYSVYTMKECLISEYNTASVNDESGTQEDRFKINFSSIEHQYKQQNPDGTLGGVVKKGWDVKQNKAL